MRPSRVAAIAALTLVGAVGAPASAQQDPQAPAARLAGGGPVVQVKDARIKFEINSTDEDGGIQVFLDSDPWESMSIFDPEGKRVYSTSTRGNVGQLGGTELFLETGEPPFTELSLEELLELFPEGEYEFRGRGIEGERFVGSAQLTHNLPDGPTLVSPLEGGPPQNPQNTTVTWEPVEPANGSPIVGYQVLVVQPDTGLTALPKITLDVMMPPTATSMAVPPGFLQPNTEYEWEVLAIEQGGNQTLSSSFFTTSS
jgi:Fibronectin type III domain